MNVCDSCYLVIEKAASFTEACIIYSTIMSKVLKAILYFLLKSECMEFSLLEEYKLDEVSLYL